MVDRAGRAVAGGGALARKEGWGYGQGGESRSASACRGAGGQLPLEDSFKQLTKYKASRI